ncbi:hypothetical protein C1645_833659 [Glomus cerebriforme]|uniref:HMG box domain-containing protein n=1 Tax=Glomus cerebriforme TaxID=658196 RepID=A0A397SLU9_9GLOM|nr:hypothetical protein C1645_833659 [Glomus cerebriforme]
MSEFRVLQYIYQQESDSVGIIGKQKKKPNSFILFTKKLRESVPKNVKIQQKKLNRFAAYLWNEKMTDYEKNFWKEHSEFIQMTPEEKEITTFIRQRSKNKQKLNQLNDCSYKEFLLNNCVLKNDCFLTESLELNWSYESL